MTSSPLRVLLVEDSPIDAELVLHALGKLGKLEHRRVDDDAQLRAALVDFAPDVILSDFSMHGYSGMAALATAVEVVPEVPFIFVSATIGDDLAADTLRRGAAEYVLKDRLQGLPAAVERALEVARHRLEQQQTQRALSDSEARFRSIVESSQDWIWELDREGLFTYNNPAVKRVLDYAPGALLGKGCSGLMLPHSCAPMPKPTPRRCIVQSPPARAGTIFVCASAIATVASACSRAPAS